MQKLKIAPFGLGGLCLAISLMIAGCSKSSDDPGTTDPCAGKNLTLNAAATSSDHCLPNGSIQATAGGSAGFTYSLDNGPYQSGSTFNSVASGAHNLTVKDNSGCTKTITVNVGAGTAGALFNAVRAIVAANCAVPGCHSGSAPTGNINFTSDCNIVEKSARIKVRAIDEAGTATQMPQPPRAALSQADQAKISEWIAAGAKFSD